MNNNTRKLTFIAILSALSFVLMLVSFPIIPGADFLKIDFSIVPILFALVLYDLRSAYAVLILRSILKLILNNGGAGSMIGLPMNIVAVGLFVTAFAYIWNKQRNVSHLSIASVVGTIALTVAMIVLNYFYAVPLYAKFAIFDINAYIGLKNYLVGMVLPFNIVEGIIFAVIFAVLYYATRPVLERYATN